MPFIAEEVFQKVKGKNEKESVHLEAWPTIETLENDPILSLMETTRNIVSLGLEARAKQGIKVRQPLKKITLPLSEKQPFLVPVGKEFLALIMERVNVKDVVFGDIPEKVLLDTEITPALKDEGNIREFIRNTQELRKKENLNPGDTSYTLLVATNEEGSAFIKKFEKEISKATLFGTIEYVTEVEGEKSKIEEMEFTLAVKKIS